MHDHSTEGAKDSLRAELERMREHEAATREILSVISQSRDDVGPVFDVVLEMAARLCGAPFACLFLANPERTHLTIPAYHGTTSKFVDLINDDPLPLDPSQSLSAQAFVERRPLQVADFSDSPMYRSGQRHRVHAVEVEGIRTVLTVPLIVGDEAYGVILLYRREVALFKEDEIGLVETFAKQAVIAIENARQFREVQTRLEREEAAREILHVISKSRTDTAPVFEVILRNAAQLCSAPMAGMAICNADQTELVMEAHWGESLSHLVVDQTAWPMDGPTANATSVREQRIVHVGDLKDTDAYRDGDPGRVEAVDKEGIRTFLAVPLFAGGLAIGCIALYRREVQPFDDSQIELVQSFAAQAVIAIENVRQFRELQSRLERETATAEILEVISCSRDDDHPVFKAIVGNAAQLCSAERCGLHILNEDQGRISFEAMWGEASDEFVPGSYAYDLDDPSPVARSIRERGRIHINDLSEDELYLAGDEFHRKLVDDVGYRTLLSVPLMRRGDVLGAIAVWRTEVKSFSEGEIAMVEAFAAQAVIAIENVKQFKALESLNAELGDRVEEQVDEIERMGRLKRFLPTAVADTVMSSGSEGLLKSHRVLLGVLMCDIRGFTAFVETAEPEETIEVLQTYHEEMGKLINASGAGVDQRVGDGLMVLFNDPLPCDDPAGQAVRLAMAMRARMNELCASWKKLGHRLGFGVGVSLGYATVGIVGFEGRIDYSASGTAINLAARLCDEASDGEILLSPRARISVEDDFQVELRDEISFKGIREPVEVFKLSDSVLG
ncbi:MAG: GAF domain-containing protein [Rhodobacteraceae bacterium]|nr:GAF domain-containing protein [Paracoccaceae bacterium]